MTGSDHPLAEGDTDHSELDHGCKIVRLYPYSHQVGGHNCLMCYDERTVCKPLNETEFKYYTQLPSDLKPFAPEYKGVIKVHFEPSEQGLLCFGLPDDCSLTKDFKRLRNYLLATKALRDIKTSCREQPNSSSDEASEEDADIMCQLTPCTTSNSTKNPWTNEIQDRLVEQWRKGLNKGLDKFILLENVSCQFKYPSAVDLKMGTRGHGDAVSEEKKDRHRQRAEQSTSKSMGVRLCGMQVYHSSTDTYHFTDKYQGRRCDVSGFKYYMSQFLFNGARYRTELLPQCIRKLKALLQCVKQRDGFRFYCSSLLIMYDGLERSGYERPEPEIEVRMIDFAQTRLKQEETNQHVGPDHGYILGLTSLIDVFSELLASLSENVSVANDVSDCADATSSSVPIAS